MIGFPKTIRWRMQLWYGVLLVAVLGGFGFTAFQFERARRYRLLDDELQSRVSTLVVALRATNRPAQSDSGAPPRERQSGPPQPTDVRLTPAQTALFGGEGGYYFAVWFRDKEPILRSANAPKSIPQPQNREGSVRMRGVYRESFLFAAPVDCVLVGRSIAAEEADLRTFAAVLAAIGSAVLAIGLLGGWWLITQATRPIDEISSAAEKIAAGNLSERISTRDRESELGRLASVLNSTFARLDAAFAQQVQFTADAAHELRTPVAVMLTQTQSALAHPRTAEEYRETIEACERATQRMRTLTESLLELARLDAGQEPMRREACDLSEITTNCIELVRPLAERRNIRLNVDLRTAPCTGDAEHLAQVASNLLTNAIDYSHVGGEITVVTTPRNGIAVLSVSNSGQGIPAEDLPHIFERFRRVEKARTAGHSGLGLAITKAIVDAHGGSIECSSELDGRVTFVVRLPN